MLPKVATTILHSTSRAATAVQNQSHTIRNVLQLQSTPSAGPSGSNSGRGNGPSSGSQKHNAGSRFQSGFYGASRSVSQANLLASQDTSIFQSDENDDTPQPPAHSSQSTRGPRLRSHSISLHGRERLGVFSTVQLHTRSNHTFAYQVVNIKPSLSRDNSASIDSPRENSTVATFEPSDLASTLPPSPQLAKAKGKLSNPHVTRLLQAKESRDFATVTEAVEQFRTTCTEPTIDEFNAALDALYHTRLSGEPLKLLLSVYDDLLRSGLLPNYQTYTCLLRALIVRDNEVVEELKLLEKTEKHREKTNPRMSSEFIQKRILALKTEETFPSACAIFQAILHLGYSNRLPSYIYSDFLSMCARYSSAEMALKAWMAFEKTSFKPPSSMYTAMLNIYGDAGNIRDVESIFNDYASACEAGEIFWSENREVAMESHMMAWNSMIRSCFKCGFQDKAVHIVDTMISSCPSVTGDYPDNEPPPYAKIDFTKPPAPSSATFTTVIKGFISMNDVPTALLWFNQLLQQRHPPPIKPFLPILAPCRPDRIAWRAMISALGDAEMVEEGNLLLVTFREHQLEQTDKVTLLDVDVLPLFEANLATVSKIEQSVSSGQEHTSQLKTAISYLNAIGAYVVDVMDPKRAFACIVRLAGAYLHIGAVDLATEIFMRPIYNDSIYRAKYGTGLARSVANQLLNILEESVPSQIKSGDFNDMLRNALLADRAYILGSLSRSVRLMEAFRLSHHADVLRDNLAFIPVILESAVMVENADEQSVKAIDPNFVRMPLLAMLKEFVNANYDLSKLPSHLVITTIQTAVRREGADYVREFFTKSLPQNFTARYSHHIPLINHIPMAPESPSPRPSIFTDSATLSTPLTSPVFRTRKLSIDYALSTRLHPRLRSILTSPGDHFTTVQDVMKEFNDSYQRGRILKPATMAKLIEALGRTKATEEVKRVYAIAQDLIAHLPSNNFLQRTSWSQVEDAMIVALLYADDLDGAHYHRQRLLEQGGAPSGDAYGSLILHVKETTDDTSNAMALYRESQEHHVEPTIFLFNNIISKLAKARKADHALQIFADMKLTQIQPTSITYGAVIGACSRVGDIDSAERLFVEMIASPRFRPRVPPYNTMMQLYTTTKPNQEKSLYYYNQMLNAGIKPSAYTYKLLIDTYVLEPIDMEKVESIFYDVAVKGVVELQTNHFASLINAYGCVLKDLTKAMEIFDSLSSYGARAPQLDALMVEAMLNVLAVHRRCDLIPHYVGKLTEAGVHLTAYVMNAVIKGYSVVGELDKAREAFETMVDPPQGYAAPHNHTPHDLASAPTVNPMEPVYREPSTWEVMVRCELGAGNRDAAMLLLERLKERQYPEAVYTRISGIMIDHSMIPPMSSL